MRELFADTFYWAAIADPSDQWHRRAAEIDESLGEGTRLVTTDEVLSEFATHLGARDPRLRRAAVRYVRAILQSSRVRVIAQSRDSFLAGLDLFENRLDKLYSFTDCVSMVTMRSEGLTEALTRDHHFAQEGFITLFSESRAKPDRFQAATAYLPGSCFGYTSADANPAAVAP